jgi:hypothetical protein
MTFCLKNTLDLHSTTITVFVLPDTRSTVARVDGGPATAAAGRNCCMSEILLLRIRRRIVIIQK